MAGISTLWDIEKRLWTGGADVYESHMAPDCLMVFPPPAGIMNREGILEALRQAPRWDNVEFDNEHASQAAPDMVTLAYIGRGQRGTDTYEALCSSTYRRTNGNWAIIQHQQTPVGS